LARIAFRDSSREGVLLLLESGRALAAIEWRARLSANRYPPRIKVREKAFAEHALTGRMHRNDESISGSQTQAIIAGAPAVIAAASKRHVVRRGDRPFAPMIPVGLLSVWPGPIATFRQHFATIFSRLRLNRRQPHCGL
jgi:hypothetical protein